MFDYMQKLRYRWNYKKWSSKGKPEPVPHFVKQMVVLEYAAKSGIDIFIETGTYLGDMLKAVKRRFDMIYSIELSEEYFNRAKRKFQRHRHIEIFQGDSTDVLPMLVSKIERPALFWLDAHYSSGKTARGKKDTPIIEELKTIFDSKISGHVILIDDARCFTGENDYPEIEDLKAFTVEKYPKSSFELQDDIIRILTFR